MDPKGWRGKARDAVVLLLVIAFAAHLVWSWLQPLAPVLIALLVLATVYGIIFGRARR